jgi:hypothetical protein
VQIRSFTEHPFIELIKTTTMTLYTFTAAANLQRQTRLLFVLTLLLWTLMSASSVSGFSMGWTRSRTTAAAFVSRSPQQGHRPIDTAAWFGRRLLLPHAARAMTSVLQLSSSSGGDPDQDGADLAAAFFKAAQAKGIDREELLQLEEFEDIDDDDEEEEDDDNVSRQGAVMNAMSESSSRLNAGNVSLTDDKIYSEVKERVLDTAGGFVDFVKRARDDDEDDDDDDDDDDELEISNDANKPYAPPTTVPDSELTAGEVIIVVLDALLHNDVPTKNRGVEIFFGYSSAGSQVKTEVGLTPDEYADFLKETEYKVLFDHKGVSIDKADYSFDGKKAFFTARLQTGAGPLDIVSVNFILSTKGAQDDDCWLIDSMLIRPESMRRRRRR